MSSPCPTTTYCLSSCHSGLSPGAPASRAQDRPGGSNTFTAFVSPPSCGTAALIKDEGLCLLGYSVSRFRSVAYPYKYVFLQESRSFRPDGGQERDSRRALRAWSVTGCPNSESRVPGPGSRVTPPCHWPKAANVLRTTASGVPPWRMVCTAHPTRWNGSPRRHGVH